MPTPSAFHEPAVNTNGAHLGAEGAQVNLGTSDAQDRPEPRCQALPRPARLGSERTEEPGRAGHADRSGDHRFADLLRVASILVVVAGHWLMAVVVQPLWPPASSPT